MHTAEEITLGVKSTRSHFPFFSSASCLLFCSSPLPHSTLTLLLFDVFLSCGVLKIVIIIIPYASFDYVILLANYSVRGLFDAGICEL